MDETPAPDPLAYTVPDNLDEAPPPKIPSDGDADRWLRARAWHQDQIARHTDTAQAIIDDAHTWLEDVTARHESSVVWLDQALEAYARRNGAKTLKLPAGELRLRKARQSVWLADGAVSDLPDPYRRVTVAPDKKTLLKQCVPGTQAAIRPPNTPTGYTPFEAVDPDTGLVLEGVVLLVPDDDTSLFSVGGDQQ